MEEFNSSQAIYLQIMERLQKEIAAQTLKAGQQLPTVRESALVYKVNPNTVQRAYSELERLGLVRSERTSGRYVTEDKVMIENLKRDLIQDKVNHLVHELKQLNISESESIDFIKNAFKKEDKK